MLNLPSIVSLVIPLFSVLENNEPDIDNYSLSDRIFNAEVDVILLNRHQ